MAARSRGRDDRVAGRLPETVPRQDGTIAGSRRRSRSRGPNGLFLDAAARSGREALMPVEQAPVIAWRAIAPALSLGIGSVVTLMLGAFRPRLTRAAFA